MPLVDAQVDVAEALRDPHAEVDAAEAGADYTDLHRPVAVERRVLDREGGGAGRWVRRGIHGYGVRPCLRKVRQNKARLSRVLGLREGFSYICIVREKDTELVYLYLYLYMYSKRNHRHFICEEV